MSARYFIPVPNELLQPGLVEVVIADLAKAGLTVAGNYGPRDKTSVWFQVDDPAAAEELDGKHVALTYRPVITEGPYGIEITSRTVIDS
ncbi:MAG TPA: hypothetical protein VFQ44_01875 [Streptosporangiaceae bacterium]|nr:hypothetical protein [Streptosporangiaceae bacterium]